MADALTEMIAERLAKLHDLAVARRFASTTVNSGQPPDVTIEGTVQKSGDDISVSVEVACKGEDARRYSWDRTFNNLFGIEGDIAKQIANHLRAEMTADEKDAIGDIGTVNADVYSAYLRGLLLPIPRVIGHRTRQR